MFYGTTAVFGEPFRNSSLSERRIETDTKKITEFQVDQVDCLQNHKAAIVRRHDGFWSTMTDHPIVSDDNDGH